jgi:arginyl-tRNA synthetase
MPLIQVLLSDILLAGARAALVAGELPACDLPESAPINRPKTPEWGDFSSALALQLSKATGRKPLEVAETIQRFLPRAEMVGSTSVTPPGFINRTLSSEWLVAQVDVILKAGPSYADLDLGGGRKAQVEFVSANPTGPLTVGRGRGGVIGDTMANLLEAAGYDITREYYFNNAGRQMRELGESLRLRYLQALGQAVDFPEGLYQGEYLAELGRKLAGERGDSLAEASWETFKDVAEAAMFESIRGTLARLNIHMDVFFNENSLYEDGSVWRVLDALRARGYIYEKEGAVWFETARLAGLRTVWWSNPPVSRPTGCRTSPITRINWTAVSSSSSTCWAPTIRIPSPTCCVGCRRWATIHPGSSC